MTATPSPPRPGESLRHAGEHYAAGRFDRARALYEEIIGQNPERVDVLLRLAQLALLDNVPPQARHYAERALALAPDLPTPYGLVAEAAWRTGDYRRAAECYEELDRAALAAKARRLVDTGACILRLGAGAVTLPLVGPGPLPVIRARLGGQTANLVIDTAAGDLLIDQGVVAGLGLETLGAERIAFAGGRLATVAHTIVPDLMLGEMALTQLPAQALELSAMFAPFVHWPVHGVLGIEVLRRFRVTLDFAGGELRLAPPGTTALPAGQRLWLAGGHYPVAVAEVGVDQRVMLLLDTGMAGVDGVVARSLVAGPLLAPDAAEDVAGQGGGGEVRGRAVRLPRLCLGGYCRGPARVAVLERFALERQLGFRIAGLLASDFFRDNALTLDFERMQFAL